MPWAVNHGTMTGDSHRGNEGGSQGVRDVRQGYVSQKRAYEFYRNDLYGGQYPCHALQSHYTMTSEPADVERLLRLAGCIERDEVFMGRAKCTLSLF
jgi:hypothetical protein